MARQLKEIEANQETDPFVRKEVVSRNLEANEQNHKRIADAIVTIKTVMQKYSNEKMLEEKMTIYGPRRRRWCQVRHPKHAFQTGSTKKLSRQKRTDEGNFRTMES